jgi:hypothetical protein
MECRRHKEANQQRKPRQVEFVIFFTSDGLTDGPPRRLVACGQQLGSYLVGFLATDSQVLKARDALAGFERQPCTLVS